MALTPCRECQQPVSTEARACPHCGASQPWRKKGEPSWFAIFLVIMLLAVLAIFAFQL